MEMLRLYRDATGDQASRFPHAFPLTERDIQDVGARLSSSPEAVKTLGEAPDLETKRRIVREWLGAALFSRIAPPVSNEDLQRFLEEHVDATTRDFLENLPRDRMLSELRRMYYVFRFQGARGEPFPRPFPKRPPPDMFPPR
jgi:hypothetical protein